MEVMLSRGRVAINRTSDDIEALFSTDVLRKVVSCSARNVSWKCNYPLPHFESLTYYESDTKIIPWFKKV